MERLTLLALALVFSGCAAGNSSLTTSADRQAAFIPAEYAAFDTAGTGTITGQAFLRTRDGNVKLGAGRQVILNPATSYSTEWFQRHVRGGQKLEKPDPRASSYVRTTVADADGRFRFTGLPAGSYFLACEIKWEIPSGSIWVATTQTVGGFAHGTAELPLVAPWTLW